MHHRLRNIARAVMAVTWLGVLLVAALAKGPPRSAAARGDERALFDEVVKNEPTARAQALEDWPQHRWSQLDAFGALERERVFTLARERGLEAQDVFGVLDEGLRAGWTGPDGRALPATVVPLKPRPMD